jgi:ribosomal protein S18 acetylase RimI-like enzyme
MSRAFATSPRRSDGRAPNLTYVASLDAVAAADLDGFLQHWDFVPPAGTLLRMLKGSSIVVLARDTASSTVCGYVAALTDHVVCGYITALEVRPEWRGRGIGTELLRRVTERLDVDGIYLTCAPAMIPFYESAGFRRGTAMAKRRSPVADGA